MLSIAQAGLPSTQLIGQHEENVRLAPLGTGRNRAGQKKQTEHRLADTLVHFAPASVTHLLVRDDPAFCVGNEQRSTSDYHAVKHGR